MAPHAKPVPGTRPSHKRAGSSGGEPYISAWTRRDTGATCWVLRLPRALDPKRRKFTAAHTGAGLEELTKLRDRLIVELAAKKREAIKRASPEHKLTWREAIEDYTGETTIKTADERRRLLSLHTRQMLSMLVTSIGHAEVNRALVDAARKLSPSSVNHLRHGIHQVLRFVLLREQLEDLNWWDRVRQNKDLTFGKKRDKRRRVILSDHEVAQFLEAENVPLELRTLAICARALGGMRTSDLHAWEWAHVDTAGWTDAFIPRPKTENDDDFPPRSELPEPVVRFLRRWWVEQGSPARGPVFPTRRARRSATGSKGVHKGRGISYAARLRKWLRAVGITRHEIHHDTVSTRRADFHSFRRAFNTALARAGVNVQTAMQLAGHKDPETHMRYVVPDRLTVPQSAVPELTASSDSGFVQEQ